MAAGVDEFADTLAEFSPLERKTRRKQPFGMASYMGVFQFFRVFQNCSELNTSALANSAVS